MDADGEGSPVTRYTAIFGSEKEESMAPDGDGSAEVPDAAEETEDPSGLACPLLIGAVVLALGAGGMFAYKKFRERR